MQRLKYFPFFYINDVHFRWFTFGNYVLTAPFATTIYWGNIKAWCNGPLYLCHKLVLPRVVVAGCNRMNLVESIINRRGSRLP